MSESSSVYPRFPHMLYGGDYNPEQWLDYPDVLQEDLRLMRLAHVNTVSIGIFSWVSLEPDEGRFTFEWMDEVIGRLHENGVRINLATPTGAKPAWMAARYPEIRRVDRNGNREPQQGRHNHCPTSPVYREKARIINTKLAERYGKHPALQLWHLSNEYGGYCYCDLCKAAFRDWLRVRYNDDLEAVNHAWWARFWSHSFRSWDEIDFIDNGVHGMLLDWKRFMTDQTTDFMRHEIEPLRKLSPDIPVTTNMMGTYEELNYRKMAPYVDVISWDSYPGWHSRTSDIDTLAGTAFVHDLNRAMKPDRPWLLMETTPSSTNWQQVSRARRPGVNRLNGLQAIAHGSDSILYFQWRKSRGSTEKFHGAVVDHVGNEHNRVFRESAQIGDEISHLDDITGTRIRPEVAVIYDWENRWAIDVSQGPRNSHKSYVETCEAHYKPFWNRGIAVDVIDSEADFSSYKVLVAPMLYQVRPGVAERITAFVEQGGTFVTTYLSGVANESDLCFLGGFPGPLRPVLGIWAEETDVMFDFHTQTVSPTPAAESLGLSGAYPARHYSEVIHAEGAEILATYGEDYYAGGPALTRNVYGKGEAYYVASRNDVRFQEDLLGGIASRLGLRRAIDIALPEGVTATRRGDENGKSFVFLMNANPAPTSIDLGGTSYTDRSIGGDGKTVTGETSIPGYGVLILEA